MSFLKIENLQVKVPEKEILKGINLNINRGEVHVIMGPNGNGKSTLASSLMGDPRFEITGGQVTFKDEDLLEMSVDKRALSGIFLAMQYPSELTGVTNTQFIKSALSSKRGDNNRMRLTELYKKINLCASELELDKQFPERFVNVGFSGGEKKRNEIFQMLALEPDFIMLDEIDSGLDIDAIRIVGNAVMKYFNENKERVSIMIITHYPRILEYIKPDFVHILKDGKIVKTGDASLANSLETSGYSEV